MVATQCRLAGRCSQPCDRAFLETRVGFAALLVSHVLLLVVDPTYHSHEGIMVQAIGQKIIVYASVTSIFIQAYGAKKLAGESLDSRRR